jgi:hypothetical protein
MAAGPFLGRHVDEETDGFIADITRKQHSWPLRSGVPA